MATRKIDLMYKFFGKSESEDDICGNCKNLTAWGRNNNNANYYKCKHYGYSHSEATDFRCGYRACGLYNKDYDGRRVVELVRPDRRVDDEPTKGQISMFDYMSKGD